jgi:DNA polymerase-3 subunit epsilon
VWHAGPLVGFDLETTGVDTTTDRVVTAAVVHLDPDGTVTKLRQWLVDPVIDIPAPATAVHGISTRHARSHGMSAASAVPDIIADLESAWRAGLPVVIFNSPFDLTLLDAEAVRCGLPRLATRSWWPTAWVVDPLVLDRGLDRYRPGKRTLAATAEHYRVAAEPAHCAVGDAITAAAVARAMAAEHGLIAGTDAQTLHSAQLGWHHDWAVHLQAYARSRGHVGAVVDKAWPLRPPVVGRHRAAEDGAGPPYVGRHRAVDQRSTGPGGADTAPHRLMSGFASCRPREKMDQ